MRLFMAVDFSDEMKSGLSDIAQRLRFHTRKGSFTLRDNFHLTLAFIGETEDVPSVKAAMDGLSCAPFALVFKGLGTFGRADSSIVWMGTEPNRELSSAVSSLVSALRAKGFRIEERDFQPHLTLGREVVFEKGFDLRSFAAEIQPIKMKVNKITLFRSDRINGRLTYTDIYEKILFEHL